MDRKNDKNCKTTGLPLIPPIDDEFFPISESVPIPDSDISSSSANRCIFANQPLVMELHEVQRDEPPNTPLPEAKTRKLSKKKRPKPDENAQDQSAGSLTSGSDSSMVPPGTERQEEFYDAHESYYEFPDPANQSSAAALRALNVSSQQENLQIKPAPETTALSDATTTTATAIEDSATGQSPISSAVIKPVHPSNPD